MKIFRTHTTDYDHKPIAFSKREAAKNPPSDDWATLVWQWAKDADHAIFQHYQKLDQFEDLEELIYLIKENELNILNPYFDSPMHDLFKDMTQKTDQTWTQYMTTLPFDVKEHFLLRRSEEEWDLFQDTFLKWLGASFSALMEFEINENN